MAEARTAFGRALKAIARRFSTHAPPHWAKPYPRDLVKQHEAEDWADAIIARSRPRGGTDGD